MSLDRIKQQLLTIHASLTALAMDYQQSLTDNGVLLFTLEPEPYFKAISDKKTFHDNPYSLFVPINYFDDEHCDELIGMSAKGLLCARGDGGVQVVEYEELSHEELANALDHLTQCPTVHSLPESIMTLLEKSLQESRLTPTHA